MSKLSELEIQRALDAAEDPRRLFPDPPDKYCVSMPDGSCVSTDPRCMHHAGGTHVVESEMTDGIAMKKHFVIFLSPGTFMAEDVTQEIDGWDIVEARRRAKEITVRYNATPYGFRFITRSRGACELDSHVSDNSPMYYLPHCKVETLEQLQARAKPDEATLRSNMECNGWNRVVTTTTGWKWTQPLRDDDVVLVACDGNHGDPECTDPECWLR